MERKREEGRRFRCITESTKFASPESSPLSREKSPCFCLIDSRVESSLGTLAPAREIPGDGEGDEGSGSEFADSIMYFLTNVNLVVPVVSAIAVIVIAIIVICVLRGGGNNRNGNSFTSTFFTY